MRKPADIALVVVHPGSACGSADFNLGSVRAEMARRRLVGELEEWTGPVILLSGDLDDEIEDYPELADALDALRQRALEQGFEPIVHQAPDPQQTEVMLELLREESALAGCREFVVTGAWYDPDDRSGCVNSVIQVIRESGAGARPGPGAVHQDSAEPAACAAEMDM
jgi:hypothetical protein